MTKCGLPNCGSKVMANGHDDNNEPIPDEFKNVLLFLYKQLLLCYLFDNLGLQAAIPNPNISTQECQACCETISQACQCSSGDEDRSSSDSDYVPPR